jgi:PAS domain-containing protein
MGAKTSSPCPCDVAAQLSVALTESRAAEQRMQALDELEHSRERFRSLAEMSSDWFWEQDKELRFTYISHGAQMRLLDRPRSRSASSAGK